MMMHILTFIATMEVPQKKNGDSSTNRASTFFTKDSSFAAEQGIIFNTVNMSIASLHDLTRAIYLRVPIGP